MIGSIISAIGGAIGGLFKFKGAQADVMQSAIKALGDANASNAQREAAIATIIAAEASSGSWLATNWRPLFMVVFMIMLLSYWFGYVPPNLTGEMPPMIAEIFTIIKIGLGGYIGGRTIEKVIGSLNMGRVLQKFIEKKLA